MTLENLSASVQVRLQKGARTSKRPFQELLQYYSMERFLYRLSKTPHRARFVLKGALMLHVWDAPLARATKDIDFLGRLDNSLDNLERVVREVCAADVEPDGMVFADASVTAATSSLADLRSRLASTLTDRDGSFEMSFDDHEFDGGASRRRDVAILSSGCIGPMDGMPSCHLSLPPSATSEADTRRGVVVRKLSIADVERSTGRA